MKKRLNELLLSELIELVCGDLNVLKEKGDRIDEVELAVTARSIISEYTFIADGVHAKAVLMNNETELKDKSNILILRICERLLSVGSEEMVREILSEIGENPGGDVREKVEELLRYAIFEQERNQQTKEVSEHRSPDDLRSSFYSEIAFIMTYFKMNINAREINAEVYANLVKQADIEIRSRKSVR